MHDTDTPRAEITLEERVAQLEIRLGAIEPHVIIHETRIADAEQIGRAVLDDLNAAADAVDRAISGSEDSE